MNIPQGVEIIIQKKKKSKQKMGGVEMGCQH